MRSHRTQALVIADVNRRDRAPLDAAPRGRHRLGAPRSPTALVPFVVVGQASVTTNEDQLLCRGMPHEREERARSVEGVANSRAAPSSAAIACRGG